MCTGYRYSSFCNPSHDPPVEKKLNDTTPVHHDNCQAATMRAVIWNEICISQLHTGWSRRVPKPCSQVQRRSLDSQLLLVPEDSFPIRISVTWETCISSTQLLSTSVSPCFVSTQNVHNFSYFFTCCQVLLWFGHHLGANGWQRWWFILLEFRQDCLHC